MQNSPSSSGLPEGTRLESVEDIRALLQAKRTPTIQEQLPAPESVPFRPFRRPPTAMLCILHDGQSDGEWHCLRADDTTIGRTQGDYLIPHDAMISGSHAHILRQVQGDRFVWSLIDLQSTNGTFVRVGAALLKHEQEVLLGSRRFRFEVPEALAISEATADPLRKGTQGWTAPKPQAFFPTLVEVQQNGDGQRFALSKSDNWVGRDPGTCVVAIPDDQFLSTPHARIHRDERGRWFIENMKSLNGTWLRIERLAITSTCLFQLGEQRFLLRVS